MTAVAVILAGGKGTRAADPSTAKIVQVLGGATLLEWHLRMLKHSEVTDVIVVSGHLGEQVRDVAERVDTNGLRVTVWQEEKQQGTTAALALAASTTKANEFVVVLGDIFMSLPIQDFINQWRSSTRSVGVVVHPSTHPADSDAVFPSHEGTVHVAPKGQEREYVPNLSSAGLFAVNRTAIEKYGELKDLGSNVLPTAAHESDLFVFLTSHYLKDTGTPERLRSAESDIASGAFARRGSLDPRAALFLDRDGVINPSQPEVYQPENFSLLPGIAEAIKQANSAGVPVIVVTNQPGIAKGFMTFDDHQRIRARMDHLLGEHGAFVDDYLFCPHHPDSGFHGEVAELKGPCKCRKPGTELGTFAARRHAINLEASVMVGDTDRDRGFSEDLGMTFVHVCADEGSCREAECFRDSCSGILRGIEVVLC